MQLYRMFSVLPWYIDTIVRETLDALLCCGVYKLWCGTTVGVEAILAYVVEGDEKWEGKLNRVWCGGGEGR